MALQAGFNPGGLVNTRMGEQSGSFLSASGGREMTVGTVDLGCNTGGYVGSTQVQVGRKRTYRKKSKTSKGKGKSKTSKTKTHRRKQTRKVRRHRRKEQVGRGITYAQDLSAPLPNMGVHAARADVVSVQT